MYTPEVQKVVTEQSSMKLMLGAMLLARGPPLHLPWTAQPGRCRALMSTSSALDDTALIAVTRCWIDKVVIGHNLCPFAAPVREHIRTTVCSGGSTAAMEALISELALLRAAPPQEPATTLIVLPNESFGQFDSLMRLQQHAQDVADEDEGAARVQVLPFHPDAAYSDAAHDPAHVSTRSPLPILHLLREADVDAAEEGWVESHNAKGEAAPEIQLRNAAYLRGIGWEQAHALTTLCDPNHEKDES
jgi:hypothetical protein